MRNERQCDTNPKWNTKRNGNYVAASHSNPNGIEVALEATLISMISGLSDVSLSPKGADPKGAECISAETLRWSPKCASQTNPHVGIQYEVKGINTISSNY